MVSVQQIVLLLTDRLESLVAQLLPGGRRQGPEWVAGDLDGGPGRSLSVCLQGDRRGLWADFADATGRVRGDALDLVSWCKCNGDKREGIKWARAWLGLDQIDPARFESQRREAYAKREAMLKQAEADGTRKRKLGKSLFLAAQEKIAGTPVDRYLKGRGLDLSRLGRQPRSLRYHPALQHPDGGVWPAMVAAVVGRSGEMVAVHRTFLQVHPDGRVTKAPLGARAKLVLGGYQGAGIRLWRGERTDPKTGEIKAGVPLGEARPGETVIVSEGIEDGLTAVLARPQFRVMAACSLSNLASLWLPDTVIRVIFLAQNDEHPQAIAALQKAVAAHRAAGREVLLPRPPAGVKDVNDMVKPEDRGSAA